MQDQQLQKRILTIQVRRRFPTTKQGKVIDVDSTKLGFFSDAQLTCPLMFWRAPSNVQSVPPTLATETSKNYCTSNILMYDVQNLYSLEISIQVSSSM